MGRLTRRDLLGSGAALALGGLAGCSGVVGRPATETATPRGDESGDGETALTDWERSTDCEGEHDGMYDSVIRVERVAASVDAEYAPIAFDDLTMGEREILRAVTEDGGYGTCDPSEAFDRFVDRVVDHGERQRADGNRIYLECDDTYYGLYVEVSDQVYAY